MEPKFPNFKKLEITDQQLFEEVQKGYPPYSDHHFTSLWSYNVDKDNEISLLNGNLVIKFADYNTSQPICTFVGPHKIADTIEKLMEYLKKKESHMELKVIPEHCIRDHMSELILRYDITEDRDNFDYIIDVDTMIHLRGNDLHSKRQRINQFLSENRAHTSLPINLKDPRVQKEIEELFLLWKTFKKRTDDVTKTEHEAIRRCIEYSTYFNLVNIGIYIEDRLIGFSINEVLRNGYYVGHFGKFHPEFTGGFQYLEHVTAKCMKEFGCKYMNYEQDLGDPGLREFKASWCPSRYLKKYTIKPKG